MYFAVYGTYTKCITGTQTFQISTLQWLEAHHCVPYIVKDEQIDTRRSNTVDNTDVIKIGQ